MKLETIEVRLPAHWASALIAGDDSGMDDAEITELEETMEHLGLANSSCVSVEDESFQRAPSYLPWLLDGTYATFAFLVRADTEADK
jgi:hypothetical protein